MALGNILSGLGAGALSGASAGSLFGPIGSGIGAGIGALAGGFGGAKRKGDIFNTQESLTEIESFTPEQKNLLSQLMQALTGEGGPQGGVLGSLLGNDSIGASSMREFNEKIVPKLAEKFAGLGAGSQSSSAFQQSLGAAGADLAERLATLDSKRQLGILGPLLQSVLTPQTNQYFQPSGPSAFSQGIGNLLGGLGSELGKYGVNKFFNSFGNKTAKPDISENFRDIGKLIGSGI